MLRNPEQVKQNAPPIFQSCIKVLLMKTLSEATRNRNLERVEEIGGVIPKMKNFVYDENDDGNLNSFLYQVTVATVAGIHNRAGKPRGKNKIRANNF